MKNSNQLYLAVLLVVSLIVLGVGASFAYINKATSTGNTLVNLTVLNSTNDLVLSYSGDTSMAINVTLDDLTSNKIGTAISDTANVKINFTTSSYYTSGAKCYYTIKYVATNTFTPTSSSINELTISGTDGTRSFAETTLGNVSSTQLYSGYISTSQASTTVTHNWTFTMKFYNINADQTTVLEAGQNPQGTITIVPGTCEAN